MEKNTKILIVDDDEGIGTMLKTLLEFSGYEVVFSEEPEHTKQNIKKHKIDLVVLDMLISGVNGKDVCKGLKEDETTKKVPVLMMSALHNAEVSCREAGANDFVAKPFEMEQLLERISNLLSENN